MQGIRRSAWRGFARVLVAVVWPCIATAQLAPTGGHYAGRASDTGHAPGMVNGSGGYSASVPLDLPLARGGLPVPLSISSGANGVGAAGLGWDIPFSYVRRDKSFARRKPTFGSDTAPVGRTQVLLSLQGRTMDLVPKGQTWVARYDAPDLFLREQNGTWVMYDGQGKTWTFVEPAALAGAGLWLLQSISAPGGSTVQLEYSVSTPALTGGSGVSIELARVLYNKHPTSACFKHEITLTYGAAATEPLSLSILGDRVLARMRTLSTVDVGSREGCTGPTERLRRYVFTYLPDADTQQPRLSAVQLYGRQGTPEQSLALPVVAFTYGSAISSGKLTYQKTQSIPLPTGPDPTKLSGTERDGTFTPPIPAGEGSATWQSLTDVTGDGRPDLVYAKSGKLWVALNRPGSAGTTTLGAGLAVGPLADTTFANGAFETRSATHNRFTSDASSVNIDQVWRQAIDVNGDGRVDIIDAAETAGSWVIYLNTPGTGASGVKWERRAYPIAALHNHLWRRGHSVRSDYLPLASRFTGRDRVVGACLRFNGMEWVSYPEGFTNGFCGQIPDQVLSMGGEKTYTEWEVKDVNGDGFPDVVFNSSRVDRVVLGRPQYSGALYEVLNTQLQLRVQPMAGDANKVDAMFNLRGLLLDENINVFSAPLSLRENTACGLGLWATSGSRQSVVCDLADVNGDGLLDRVEDTSTVLLGTGRGFSPVQLKLPRWLASQRSGQVATCVDPEPDAPGATLFGAAQRGGLRDVTGDGIPDYVEWHESNPVWRVAVGTGAGFAPAVDIEVIGSGFSLSSENERCDGKTSNTTSGLYDINGDGRPEVVRVNGNALDVYQLVGSGPAGRPEAGRIVQVDNGYGAKTNIGYRSAKEDGTTPHQVPFPEIVVTSVQTVGSQQLGGTLSATRYAYGGAELMYDSALQAFVLPAYQRSVELHVLSVVGGRAEGLATLTDTYPLVPFTSQPKPERFGRYLQAGKVRDVTVLSGDVNTDPWTMLTTDVTTDARRRAGTHYTWTARLFEEPAIPGASALDCFEMIYPLDFLSSWVDGVDGYNTCSAHGFVYGSTTDSWRGQAAPPSTQNVATHSEVRDVDDYGRVLTLLHGKDAHRGDDDLCVETRYAVPVGTNERVLSAPTSRWFWDCNKNVTFASESWTYDGLPPGSVSAGHVTAHLLDRRSTSTGAVLSTVREYNARYDAAGNLLSVTRKREDGASRTTTLGYDPFGLMLVVEHVDASGLPPFESSITLDPISLAPLSSTDANLTTHGTDFDGYGRPVRSTVTPAGGSMGVMAMSTYLGFSGTDPLGRRILNTVFSDPVSPGREGDAPGRTGTVFLDELGRSRRTELALGSDHAGERLITGARTYDGLGRVAFQADTYPASQNAATAYGTTSYFNLDGTPSCSLRGHGPQPLTSVTNEASERYATCYARSFLDHQETVSVSDAASLMPGSTQAGVTRSATLTALGRLLSRSTWKGTARLEHATFTHDRLGQLTGMTRYLDPAGATSPVQWSWTYDSFGQLLQWQEPESAVQSARFDDWGELAEVSWTDTTATPVAHHTVRSSYDALGRILHHEERSNGVVDPETVNDFFYDTGKSPTSLVTPTYVLGRLARIQGPTGDVFFSYDALGRQDTRTFTDNDDTVYVEKSLFHADGSLAALEFYLPDTGFQREWAEYTYDSANSLRTIHFSDGTEDRELFAATGIDAFGRLRKARFGGVADYTASYADVGRRLMSEASVSSALGSRQLLFLDYGALGHEEVRREINDGASTGPKTNTGYDALGRLSSSLRTNGTTTLASWQYTYDALGNVLTQNDLVGSSDAALSYRTVDRDRVCRIGYGNGGLGGSTCNVSHDALGNIVEQPTRTGLRRLSYFPSGGVRSITEQGTQATFRGDAFGLIQELDLQGTGAIDARHDWKFGGLIERREQQDGGHLKSVLTRNIPGPGGIVASRRGAGKDWVFHYGEARGARFFTDQNGAFVQDVDFQPFGEATSTGSAQPGSDLYSSAQWNGGEALAAFGLSHLGARVYDPVMGRFLSRDPLFVPRTAATTNPYAFAMNDPVNRSDPTGLDPANCIGKECQGPMGTPSFPGGGGGPSGINPPWLYFPASAEPGGVNPQAAFRPPTPTTFSGAPQGPQTAAGRALKESVESSNGFPMGPSFNFDTLAASGITVEGAIALTAESQEAHAFVDEYNGTLDRFSSFSAGFGDSVWFWCPGCSQNARQAWGINSGDADSWSYGWGSVTGIVGSIALPKVTTRIKLPAANPRAELIAVASEIFPSACRKNCGYTAVAFDASVGGRPMSALSRSPMSTDLLATYFESNWVASSGPKAIASTLKGWGEGSRGIVSAGVKGSAIPDVGHVFNVVNRGGSVHFIDAGKPSFSVDFSRYYDFWLLRTH